MPGVVRTEYGLLTTHGFESDYKAAEIIININIQPKDIMTYCNYEKINIERYKRRLENRLLGHELPIYRNATITEIDTSIDNLNNIFKETIEESVYQNKFVKNKILGKLPNNIINLIKERKRLQKILHRTPDPGRYNIIRADIRNLGINIKRINNPNKSHLEKIKVNPSTFSKVKAAAGLIQREPISTLFSDRGNPINNDEEKAELLANHLQYIQQIGDSETNSTIHNFLIEAVEGIEDHNPLVSFGEETAADGVIGNEDKWTGGGFFNPTAVSDAIKKKILQKI